MIPVFVRWACPEQSNSSITHNPSRPLPRCRLSDHRTSQGVGLRASGSRAIGRPLSLCGLGSGDDVPRLPPAGVQFLAHLLAHSPLHLSTSQQQHKLLNFVRAKSSLPLCVVCRVSRKRFCRYIGSVCVSAARSLKRRGRTSRPLLGELLTLMAAFRRARTDSILGGNSRKTLP